jgi:hypothetical protein
MSQHLLEINLLIMGDGRAYLGSGEDGPQAKGDKQSAPQRGEQQGPQKAPLDESCTESYSNNRLPGCNMTLTLS